MRQEGAAAMRNLISFFPTTRKAYRFVHPLKQKSLESVFENLPDSVDELWVFGSAVTRSHYPWSDLDLFVIGDLTALDRKRVILSAGCPVDLLVDTKDNFNAHCDEFAHCYYRIKREGIKYFDRRWLDE
jgi:predicted nucleotidyltransferase